MRHAWLTQLDTSHADGQNQAVYRENKAILPNGEVAVG